MSDHAILSGHATPAVTGAYPARFPQWRGGYRPLGGTGLIASRVGFGGYRVDDETRAHRTALEAALLGGINLIDTSTNYTDGGSERLVGATLGDLVAQGRLRRDEIVVVSKIGYAQGANLTLAREREAAGQPFPEMVKYMDGCWHCLHPAFLDDQLQRSLARLRLATLDVCLLHNPEYFLSDAKKRGGGVLETRREEFYRRVREAFCFFESQVRAGRIDAYGVSSNTAVVSAGDAEATSLSRFLTAAREAGGADHHFRVLQIPMNLVESGGALEPNTGPGGTETALACATREGIAVLVNRPLNAFAEGGMIRLAEAPLGAAPLDPVAQRAVVSGLEEEFRRAIAPSVRAARGGTTPDALFRWAEHLDGAEDQVDGVERWREIEEHAIAPRVTHTVAALDRALTLGAWTAWRDRYLPELQRLLEAIGQRTAGRSAARSRAVSALVDPLLSAARGAETLSRKALWVLASTPGVSSILVGMRRQAYVQDALGMMAWPPLSNPYDVYEAMRHARESDPE
jgi:aryl-alcohol dehydrogenase-like predicted oxidoreductase